MGLCCIPFTYQSTNTKPEKINIIFAANDYFSTRDAIVKDDQLVVDDVRLIYYNTLKSLSYEGANLNFNENTLSYDLSQLKYEAAKLSFEKKAVGGSAQATYNETSGIVTIKVTGEDNASTTYSLQFKKVTGEISSISTMHTHRRICPRNKPLLHRDGRIHRRLPHRHSAGRRSKRTVRLRCSYTHSHHLHP